MSSSSTPNFGLHKWVLSDNVLMEEFNENNQKIDSAMAIAVSASERAVSLANNNTYNLYYLALENYYERLYSGSKRAMLFRGMATASDAKTFYGSMFSSADCSAGLGTASVQGAMSFSTTQNAGFTVTDSTGPVVYQCFSLNGIGKLTTASLYFTAVTTYSGGFQAYICSCDQKTGIPTTTYLASSDSITVTTSGTYSFTFNYTLEPYTKYAILLYCNNTSGKKQVNGFYTPVGNTDGTRAAYDGSLYLTDYGPAWTMNFTGTNTSSATSTLTANVGMDYNQAIGLIRYSGTGAFKVTLSNGSDSVTMEAVEERSNVSTMGSTCKELELTAPIVPAVPNSGVTLSVGATTSSSLKVFDYGAILI